MEYENVMTDRLFRQINSEAKARAWIWKLKWAGKDFECPKCKAEEFYQHRKFPEIRECRKCHQQVRLRAGTIFQNSKMSLLLWVRALYFMTQGKRGISAVELQRQLELSSYATAWAMLHKIREALRQRDEQYKLKDVIELDGAFFGRRHTGNQTAVLVAVETKEWIDAKGRKRSKAGFAKIMVAEETKQRAQEFVNQAIEKGSMVNTDGSPSLIDLKNVDVDYQVMGNDKEALDRWLPWVHKFISNAKTWMMGTHHGVESKYLAQYLAEYTYRFNRRHNPTSMFHRALLACVNAQPKTAHVLSR